MNTTLEPCRSPKKPGDPFYSEFQNACGCSSADGFENAAGSYKPGDRIGNDCLCYGNIWSPACCKSGMRVTQASTSFNAIGPLGLGSGCGPRPIGIGAKHRAKLDAWNKCMDEARKREADKKQAKIDERQAASMANAALAGAFAQPSTSAPGGGSAARTEGEPGAPAAGLSMAAKIGIGVAISAVLIGGVFGILAMTKKKKKAA